jgi:hypothetical protein
MIFNLRHSLAGVQAIHIDWWNIAQADNKTILP